MPRHLIGDAHEWINEIPTVPTHSLAKLQPSQRSWEYLCLFLYKITSVIIVQIHVTRKYLFIIFIYLYIHI